MVFITISFHFQFKNLYADSNRMIKLVLILINFQGKILLLYRSNISFNHTHLFLAELLEQAHVP